MTIDATGYSVKSLREIEDDLAARQKADIDPGLITESEEPLGQINGTQAEALNAVGDTAQIAYNAINPDAAEGFLLDGICALTGTVRLRPKKSEVYCDCTLAIGTTLIAGKHFAHVEDSPNVRFTVKEDIVAPSAGVHSVLFIAEDFGPVIANATKLNVIATQVAGWSAVSNPLDASLGYNEEEDHDLRVRRENRLQASGSATPGAIKSDVAGVEGVITAHVFENYSDTIDANGLPPHSGEVLVYDGDIAQADDDEIAQAIWDSRPLGIQLVGSTSGNALDIDGNTRVVPFSRPIVRQVYIEIAFSGNITLTAIAIAIVKAREADNDVGKDVIYNRIISDAIGAGAEDVTVLELGFGPAPSTTSNLTVAAREIASYDTSRIGAP